MKELLDKLAKAQKQIDFAMQSQSHSRYIEAQYDLLILKHRYAISVMQKINTIEAKDCLQLLEEV